MSTATASETASIQEAPPQPMHAPDVTEHRAIPVLTTRDAAGLWLAGGLAAIAAGLALLAALGPLLTDAVDYRVAETFRNQMIGLDFVSLTVVAPLALAAAMLVLRERAAGPALGLGIGSYVSYMQLQYVLGPDYLGLDGNNERLFPLCLALFALGWLVFARAWAMLDARDLPSSRRRDLLLGRVVLPVLALVAFVRYVPELADVMSAPANEAYAQGPIFFWSIALLDLGVFLPATVLACAGLVRGAPWAQKALAAVVGWFGLVGPAVAAMAIAMAVNDDPLSSGGSVVFMVVLGAVFAALATVLLWPLLRGTSTGSREPATQETGFEDD